MNKKILSGLALAVATAAIFAGCGDGGKTASKDEKITIRMTYSATELDSINRDGDAVFAEFYEKYPNVTVEFEEGGSTMMAKIAANDAPDIIRCSPVDIPTYVNKNIIMPLDDYLAKSELYDENDIYPLALNTYRFDGLEFGKGSIYGLPKDWSPNTLYVNKAAFEKSGLRVPSVENPMTFSEMKTAAEKLTIKNGNDVERFGVVNLTSGVLDLIESTLNMEGKSIWSDDFKTINLKSEDAMKVAQYWFDMFKNGNSPSSLYNMSTDGNLAISEDKVGMCISALYAGRGMQENPNRTVDTEDILLTPYPVSDNTKTVYNICTPTGAVISAQTEHPDEVFACWEYIHLGPLVEKRASKGLNLPIKKSVAEKVSPESDFLKENLEMTLKIAEKDFLLPKVNPYVTGAASIFNKYWGPALEGEFSLEEALETIQDEIQILINEGVNNA